MAPNRMKTRKVSPLLTALQLSKEDELVCGLREHIALVCSTLRWGGGQQCVMAGPNRQRLKEAIQP